jgi:L-ascorbate metabolism protein UlaG (beta-lactamase superfamily)
VHELDRRALVVRRLNDDSSWHITLDGTRLLLDPWLRGDAVVALPAIHRAELASPPIPVEEAPASDALILSHPFPDHCNPTTLRALPRDLPVYAPPVAARLSRWLGGPPNVHVLRDATRGAGLTRVGDVGVGWCRAPAAFDTTHNALVLRGLRSGVSVVYSPHAVPAGSPVLDAVERLLEGRPLDLLLVSFTSLDLPWYLGGVANLGPEAAVAMAERLRAQQVAPTHDGSKPDTGFIARVEKLVPCRDVAALLAARGLQRSELGDGVGATLALG